MKKKMLVNMMGDTFDNDNVKKKTVRLIVGGKKGKKKRGVDLPRETGG